MKRRYWWGLAASVLCIAIALGVRTCRSQNLGVDYVPEEEAEEFESGLTLRDVTLEQQDDNGQILWRVYADEVTYSPDKEIANLSNLDGELFQDGQLLYRVEADKGIIRRNGQVILLRKNIVATGIQNQMILRGESLEWLPEEALMIVEDGLTGSHPQIRAQAQQARVYDREKRMEFEGEVIATTVVENPQQEPWIKLQGDKMEWRWEAEELSSDQSIRVERFQDNSVTEVLTGNRGLVEIPENRVTVTDDVKVRLLDIPLELTSDNAIWEVTEQIVTVDRPLKVVNEKEKVTVTSRQGRLDLATQVVYLTQDVLIVSKDDNRRLTTDNLTWNLVDQTVLAEGSVNYQQQDPQVTVRGQRATGRIEEQTVVVNGGRVVTEIVPEFD